MKNKLNKACVRIVLILTLGVIFAYYPQTTAPNVPNPEDTPSFAPLNDNAPVNTYEQ